MSVDLVVYVPEIYSTMWPGELITRRLYNFSYGGKPAHLGLTLRYSVDISIYVFFMNLEELEPYSEYIKNKGRKQLQVILQKKRERNKENKKSLQITQHKFL